MSKSKKFKEACAVIKERDGLSAFHYNLIKGKNRDSAVTLKPMYSKIAKDFLYYEIDHRGKVFSWKQVTDVCNIADLYLNEVISEYK